MSEYSLVDNTDIHNITVRPEIVDNNVQYVVLQNVGEPDTTMGVQVVENKPMSKTVPVVSSSNLSASPINTTVETTIDDKSDMPLLTNIYIGSLTVVGLYVLFRIMNQSK
jgi:hypothetical protein